MEVRSHHRTIIISDLHLGSSGAKAKELFRFLKYNSCEKLILNGDIVDGWQLRKSGKWKRKHTRVINRILKMTQEFNTKVIYTRGNHDDFLDQVIPLHIGNLSIVKDYVLESFGKKYYVVHGDVFDTITTNFKWIAKLGDIGYNFLLWVNKLYNEYRRRNGRPYYSLSQAIKQKVKGAVNFISEFENELIDLAKAKKYDGVICGHIHHAAINRSENFVYMNSGDWVESLTALTEDHKGEWNIVYYSETGKNSKLEAKTERLFGADLMQAPELPDEMLQSYAHSRR